VIIALVGATLITRVLTKDSSVVEVADKTKRSPIIILPGKEENKKEESTDTLDEIVIEEEGEIEGEIKVK
jgi:hypothetical protein